MWVSALMILMLAGAPPPADCADRWALRSLRLGLSLDEAAQVLTRNGAKLRSDDGDGGFLQVWALDKGERLLLAADRDGTAVARMTLVLTKPDDDFPALLDDYAARWGEPVLEREVVRGGRADMLSEATVWTDGACDIKATVLGIKERGAQGLQLRRVGVRVERLLDPAAHLPALRDGVMQAR